MKQVYSRFFQSTTSASVDEVYKSGVLLLQKGDYPGAVTALRAAADRGHASATYNLALMYKQGLTESFDIDEAIILFKQAGDFGHTRAQAHWNLFERLGSEEPLNDDDVSFLVQNFSRTGGDGAFVYGLANEFIRRTPDPSDLLEFVMIELSGASNGSASAQAFVRRTGIPPSSFEYSLSESREGTPARLRSDLLDRICHVVMGKGGIPQSSIVFARCSIVGYVIKKCGLAPMGALPPFTAYKDDEPEEELPEDDGPE